jgi:hypothetical protein
MQVFIQSPESGGVLIHDLRTSDTSAPQHVVHEKQASCPQQLQATFVVSEVVFCPD